MSRRKSIEQLLKEGTYRHDRHAGRIAAECDLPPEIETRDRSAPPVTSPEITAAWVRNPSDEMAVADGCRFDLGRACFAVWWIERYCRLYEGDWGGEPLVLRGCHQCDYGLTNLAESTWQDADTSRISFERAALHVECVAAGHEMDWQYECLMRLLGWERYSDKWRRWVRRFREGSIWCAKKQKKSPTVAAVALYLMAGDGEPGGKVYLGAKDGQQARKICGEHTVQMRDRSDVLRANLILNKSTMRISSKDSWLEPLSSGNERTRQGKEGINGSIIIDETHVVDREFIARISRAGISRSEPLLLECSTAGNNPDGYGKERFDLAVNVQAGIEIRQGLFAAVYAAPQEVTDAELDADPLKFGRMANPSMGHTVDPEEYLTDYANSKRTIDALADFKMYRLNIWQRASNPWIKASDWEACRRDYTEADLLGRRCGAGLDLSRTRDMSSLVLVFPMEEPDTYRILPYFWMPREWAETHNHLVNYLGWSKAGHLELTPGRVIDYGFIDKRFRELAKKFRITQLLYDVRFAEEVTQRITEGQVDEAGEAIVEGTGVERVIFPQTLANFSGPSNDFERFILNGTLHHNGHPVMTWQMGHVHVKPDANKNKRPLKPKVDSLLTIDGVVATIQGLVAAKSAQPSVYEGRGLLEI